MDGDAERAIQLGLSEQDFVDRVVNLYRTYDLSVRAVRASSTSEDALEEYWTEQYSEYTEIFERLASEQGKRASDFPAYLPFEEYKSAGATLLPSEVEAVLRKIHAAYLVNFAAIFEDHIKQCLRVLLLDNPLLLNGERTVQLGKLLAMGEDNVVLEEVDRAVQGLDRKSVEERINYLREQFGIDFFGSGGASMLKTVVDKRNAFLHERPNGGATESEAETSFFICMSGGLWLLKQIRAVAPELVSESLTTDEDRIGLLAEMPHLRAYHERRLRDRGKLASAKACRFDS